MRWWWSTILLLGCTAETSGLAEPAPSPSDTDVDTSLADSGFVAEDTALDVAEETVDSSVMPVDALPDTTDAPDSSTDTAITLADTGSDPGADTPMDTATAPDTADAGTGCPANAVMCTKVCRDLQADPAHCGGCVSAACRVGSMCASGACACQPRLSDCSGICIDTKGHPDACGGCGTKCSSGQRCQDGSCVEASSTTCPANRPVECASSDGRKACFDTKRDPMHCGGCGTDKRCSSSEVCVDGACESYVVGVGCTTCPCAACNTLLSGSRCCPAPPGSAADRVICVDAAACPLWLPL